ncbi:MAG: hypothetical protein K2G02_01295 [Phocaeicola sp.]|uniref:DUF5687 family protein n=1 Tax=Phocaeicola sp. TaxID=2773926 RepID=UPI0023CE3823|nr:DUF5687 family protein [Phocaeicola sp.]MDE5678287.1 hypothetical protein [Phocaeicola sp.]MDE6179768.1 hypothetical protein [Phocaeicola sp.]
MLLSIIRQNQKLAAKRNPAFDRNRFAKFLIYFMVAFWAAYLIFIGVMLSFAFEGIFPSMEPYHIMNQGLIYLLAIDFLLRFMLQPAMSQEIKPYLLLPVKKNKLVDTLLLQSGASSYNFFWFFLMIPFALLTVLRFYGFTGILCYMAGIWLLMVMNNYWFLICKTLLNEKWLYLLLPAGVYGLLAVAEFIPEGNPISTFTMNLSEKFIEGNIGAHLGVLAAILLLLLVNRKLQLHFIYNEMAKVEDTKMKHVSEYKFLERYGDTGEYLRLELKLCLRNKTVKTQFRMGFIIMLAFSALLAFTDAYNGAGMSNFICIYNFAILSIMTLGQVMSFEGNYLDGLMSRKESIYNLLRAKYYTNCIILFIPFLIMMIPVAKGKISFLMALSYMLFTAGFVFAMMLQLAVYNKKTIPLNANVMRSNRGSSLFQSIIISCAFFLPMMLNKMLTTFFEQDTACLIMMAIGLILIGSHNLWIKNIYNRFMKRRYENMEGFRDSR